jgi:hypothetical protein
MFCVLVGGERLASDTKPERLPPSRSAAELGICLGEGKYPGLRARTARLFAVNHIQASAMAAGEVIISLEFAHSCTAQVNAGRNCDVPLKVALRGLL